MSATIDVSLFAYQCLDALNATTSPTTLPQTSTPSTTCSSDPFGGGTCSSNGTVVYNQSVSLNSSKSIEVTTAVVIIGNFTSDQPISLAVKDTQLTVTGKCYSSFYISYMLDGSSATIKRLCGYQKLKSDSNPVKLVNKLRSRIEYSMSPLKLLGHCCNFVRDRGKDFSKVTLYDAELFFFFFFSKKLFSAVFCCRNSAVRWQ